jgi:transcription elongation factor GreB
LPRLITLIAQGHSYSTVAQRAGLTTEDVKVRLHRMRPTLRECVGEAPAAISQSVAVSRRSACRQPAELPPFPADGRGMSRAFLRESDMPDRHEARPLTPPLPPGTKNLLTAAGEKRLRDELDRLVSDQRPPLASRAGDPDTKRELQALDHRIAYLRESLRVAEVPAIPEEKDVVRFGATVTVRDRAGNESKFRLVGVDEVDPNRDEISWLSPIGRALLNSKLGQHVSVTVPRGRLEWDIVRIEYEG